MYITDKIYINFIDELDFISSSEIFDNTAIVQSYIWKGGTYGTYSPKLTAQATNKTANLDFLDWLTQEEIKQKVG